MDLMDEDDEDLQRALALSVASSTPSAGTNFSDPNFVSQLLTGADTSIQEALGQVTNQTEKEGEDQNSENEPQSKKRKGDDL
jgi:hypothetical protein